MQMIKNTRRQRLRTAAFLAISLLPLFSLIAKANSVTAQMSPEIIAEYKKHLAAQTWPKTYKKLAFMDNPYKAAYKKMKKSLKKEAPEGQRRRLMTADESTMAAKKKRFDYCQASVDFFVSFAARAYTLSRVEQNPLSEEKLMSGNGVDYPFTKEQKNNGNFRPAQIALDLGWKYQGKGEQYAESFLATCLAIPLELYYKEDKR
jgi:hypothetical protein